MGVQFDPEGLQFPLFVGKSWNTEVEAASVDGDFFNYKSSYVVEEYSIVETPVGSFKAFRIKQRIRSQEVNFTGFDNHWYAPAAKTIVKSTSTSIRGVKLLDMKLVE